jgi:hypothetical protein
MDGMAMFVAIPRAIDIVLALIHTQETKFALIVIWLGKSQSPLLGNHVP